MGKSTGRKRKPGARTANGKRPSRAGYVPLIDKGSEHAQAMVALYGQDGTDALGRAFQIGLLGEGTKAKALLDKGRQISRSYWSAYETGRYVCALSDRAHGGGTPNHDAIKAREERLNENLTTVRLMGEKVRKAFYQLVIDPQPDCGPRFLDELIWAARKGIGANPEDQQKLRAALDALEKLAS